MKSEAVLVRKVAVAGLVSVLLLAGSGSSQSSINQSTKGAVKPQSIALDPAGKFAYVLGGPSGENYVSMYTINPSTGVLASIGPPISTNGYGIYYGSGVNAGSVVVDPVGKFAYATNAGDLWDYGDGADGSVAIFAINAKTGALTSVGTVNGNCPGLCAPSSMVVDPSGKLAYVANGDGRVKYNVAMYTINSTTGALTSMGTIASGRDPISVAVDPAGKFAYVVNQRSDPDGSVSMYTIDAKTGELAPIGTIATGRSPTLIAIHPSDKFAYVTNSASNDVSMYTIDATTGGLTDTGTIATRRSPTSIAIHPSGKFAYVTNSESNSVSMYSIDRATGKLKLIGTIGA